MEAPTTNQLDTQPTSETHWLGTYEPGWRFPCVCRCGMGERQLRQSGLEYLARKGDVSTQQLTGCLRTET